MNKTEHLLVCLAEECSEVIKDVSKSLRFGLEDRNVLDPTGPTNLERLVAELNDLSALVGLLKEEGILPQNWINPDAQSQKRLKVKKFMRYARKVGSLK